MTSPERSQVEEGLATARWLLKNVKLPGDGPVAAEVVQQIQDAIAAAERRTKDVKGLKSN
jgi:hypothetical protein